MQESGLIEIIPLICTLTVWGQCPAFFRPESPQGAQLWMVPLFEGKMAIHRKMKMSKGAAKNVCWVIQKQWDTERNFNKQTSLGSSLSTHLVHIIL